MEPAPTSSQAKWDPWSSPRRQSQSFGFAFALSWNLFPSLVLVFQSLSDYDRSGQGQGHVFMPCFRRSSRVVMELRRFWGFSQAVPRTGQSHSDSTPTRDFSLGLLELPLWDLDLQRLTPLGEVPLVMRLHTTPRRGGKVPLSRLSYSRAHTCDLPTVRTRTRVSSP